MFKWLVNIFKRKTHMSENGHLVVKVMKVPGRSQEVAVEEGSTVEDAIEAAGLDADESSVQLNGRDIGDDLDREVSDGATIVLAKKVKGA